MIGPTDPYPANSGGLVRIAKVFEGLSRFHEVVLTFPKPAEAALSVALSGKASIMAFPINSPHPLKMLKAFVGYWPYHASIYYSEAMNCGIRETLRTTSYSLVYCHLIYTLPYARGAHLPVVLDQQNVDRQYWSRKVAYYRQHNNFGRYLFSLVNLWKTIQFENNMLRYVRAVVSVSDDDATETRKFAPSNVARFLVAPNGVDTAHYRPAASTPDKSQNKLVIGFLGSLDLELNRRAALTVCKEILPRVQLRLPDISVSGLIIGRNPPKELVQYARENPSAYVTVTGTVDDVLPYLHKLDVLVLPLDSGAGTKLRVLEAMSAGVCVVGTDLALMGIKGLVSGEHAMHAENIEEFEVAICKLARDAELRHRMARSARQLVERHFGWDLITSRLSCELQEIQSATPPLNP